MKLRIREIAKEKNITGVALAQMIKISQQNMSGIMTGKFNPSLKTLQKIADALGVPITELFYDSKEENNTVKCPNCGVELEIKMK